ATVPSGPRHLWRENRAVVHARPAASAPRASRKNDIPAMSFRAVPGRYRCAATESCERATDERIARPAVHRKTAEERQQGRLDLPGHARLGYVSREPCACQCPWHVRRPTVPELLHGTRRRHPQVACEDRPA